MSTLYVIDGHPLLSEKFAGLADDDKRTAQHELAELLLGLKAPAYTGADALALEHAIVQQVNYQLQQDVDPLVLRSVSTGHAGGSQTTAFRDRWLSPRAWALVEQVTKVATVAFKVPFN